jgi:hypothetical protein
MKALALLPLLAALVPFPTSAAPCASDTLASYVALGASGCEIGGANFHDFGTLDVPFGSAPVDPGAVLVTPLTGNPALPGLRFELELEASAGEILEILIGYQVSAPKLSLARLGLEGSSVAGDGAVTGIEDLCLDGIFDPGGPTGCTGDPLLLLVFDVDVDEDLVDQLAFAPVSSLAVVKDLAVDGGLEGAAELVSASNHFRLPEPGRALLCAAAALALGLRRRSIPT